MPRLLLFDWRLWTPPSMQEPCSRRGTTVHTGVPVQSKPGNPRTMLF